MKYVDVSYYYNKTTDPGCLLEAHSANLGYLHHLPGDWDKYLVKFLKTAGHRQEERTKFYFFKGSSSPIWVPRKANNFISKLQPGVVLFHGLVYPLQLLLLKSRLPAHTKLIVQHHAETPAKGFKGWVQKLAGKCIDAYVFSAKELAEPWVQAGVVPQSKIFEVMEGSTHMQRINKQIARQLLQLPDAPTCLWVGRLNANKDPLTVLRGFEKFLLLNGLAKLYMIFQDNELLPLVQKTIADSQMLAASVVLIGKVDKAQMPSWYSAADFYLSGSGTEGSGYALIEAMSCGCIPIVTNIPSFRKITADGKAGFLYNHGEADALCAALCRAHTLNNEQLTAKVLSQFNKALSFKAIAQQLVKVYEHLNAQPQAPEAG